MVLAGVVSKKKTDQQRGVRKSKRIGVNEKFEFRNIIASLFPDFASVVLERQYLLHALKQEDLSKEFVRLQSKEAYYSTPTIFTLNGVLYFNTCMHGLEELLRYADRNSMAHGREVRLPFLSHELVEFLFSLPSILRSGRAGQNGVYGRPWKERCHRRSHGARIRSGLSHRSFHGCSYPLSRK